MLDKLSRLTGSPARGAAASLVLPSGSARIISTGPPVGVHKSSGSELNQPKTDHPLIMDPDSESCATWAAAENARRPLAPRWLRARMASVWELAARRAKQTRELVKTSRRNSTEMASNLSSSDRPPSCSPSLVQPGGPGGGYPRFSKKKTIRPSPSPSQVQAVTPVYHHQDRPAPFTGGPAPETPSYAPVHHLGGTASPNKRVTGEGRGGSPMARESRALAPWRPAGNQPGQFECPTRMLSPNQPRPASGGHEVESAPTAQRGRAEVDRADDVLHSSLLGTLAAHRQQPTSHDPAGTAASSADLRHRPPRRQLFLPQTKQQHGARRPAGRSILQVSKNGTGRKLTKAAVEPKYAAGSRRATEQAAIRAAAGFLRPTSSSDQRKHLIQRRWQPKRRWHLDDNGVWRSATGRPGRGPGKPPPAVTKGTGDGDSQAKLNPPLPQSTLLIRDHIRSVRAAQQAMGVGPASAANNECGPGGFILYIGPPLKSHKLLGGGAAGTKLAPPFGGMAPLKLSGGTLGGGIGGVAGGMVQESPRHNTGINLPQRGCTPPLENLRAKQPKRVGGVSPSINQSHHLRQLALASALSAAIAFGMAAAAQRLQA